MRGLKAVSLKVLLPGLAAGLLVVLADRFTPILLPLEHSLADFRTYFLSDRAKGTSVDVAVVGIDEDALAHLPYMVPIDRAYFSELITRIDSAQPRAIVLDTVFDRPTETQKDELLARTLERANSPIILGLPPAGTALDEDFQRQFWAKAHRPAGDTTVSHTQDDVVRHIPVPATGCSLADATILALSQADTSLEPNCSRKTPLRIDWLRPSGGEQTFTYLNAGLLTGAEPHPAVTARLKGKIVVVGGVYTALDRHKTPISILEDNIQGNNGRIGGQTTPGVVVHAQAIQQLLDGRRRHDLSHWAEGILFVGAGLLGALLSRLSLLRRTFVRTFLILGACLFVIDALLFVFARTVFPGAAVGTSISLGFLAIPFINHVRRKEWKAAAEMIGESIL